MLRVADGEVGDIVGVLSSIYLNVCRFARA